ncbi:hypothetical protein GCM10009665_40870 [Kitasatospora nipponensis]|uniref:Uncharacterized protein n=1 Tax=Kitasatospora nipponensis TaxID=258049 RepID=A0ABN1WGB3_9ACTN
MVKNGFGDDVPGAGQRPEFWAGYLARMWDVDDSDSRLVASWFGTDTAGADAAWEAHLEHVGEFQLPFGDGHTVHVTSSDLFPIDWGTDYRITHPDWDPRRGDTGRLALRDGGSVRRSGHDAGPYQKGPGLSWRELTHIANTPDLGAPGVHDLHARLLLLLPALADADLPADTADVIGAALVRAGVPALEGTRAAAFFLDHPLWEAAHWTVPATGIPQCDAPRSPRFGRSLAQGITCEQADRLARALGTCPA